jgi:hypothetical protein
MELSDYSVTLVGTYSPRGHDHDDNCLTAFYSCQNGHKVHITHRRKCPADGCDWVGKLTCFCHKGDKVGLWVNDDPETQCHHRGVRRTLTTPSGIAYQETRCTECGEVID